MIPRFAAALLLAVLSLAQSSLAQTTNSRMDQIVQSYVSNKQFMGSALVAHGSDVLFSKGYGSANLEWGIPNSPSTKFRLGSVTKQFTAASILLLEERGKVKVEDLVKKYLPDAPAAWDKITIFHVLTHTAGLPNFTGFPDYQSLEPFPTTAEKLVGRFRDKPLDFEPGEKWSYSNSGYVLLGYLIEKISGESYGKFVRENIFTPLGMRDSGYDSNSAVIERRAAGYGRAPNGAVTNAGYIDMTVPHAAGALYSTTEDLLRWEQGPFGGKVLSAASLQKMTTAFKSDYAFGLQVHTVNKYKVIDHNGGIEGFSTMLAYYPEDKITVVVLANLTGTPAPGEIAAKLGALALGEDVSLPSERKEITVAPAILSKYVGAYSMAPGVNMIVRLAGDQLTTQMSGQGRLPLFAESESRFFLKVVDAQVEFGNDDKGPYLILHEGGRDMKAARTSDTVVEKKEIVVPVSILSAYVGTYELRPGFDMVVTLEGEQLITQATGQPKLPIFAESETKFFPKAIDAELEFFKDEKGAVTHLVLHQGPAEIKGTRK